KGFSKVLYRTTTQARRGAESHRREPRHHLGRQALPLLRRELGPRRFGRVGMRFAEDLIVHGSRYLPGCQKLLKPSHTRAAYRAVVRRDPRPPRLAPGMLRVRRHQITER